MASHLLAHDEPPAFEIVNADGDGGAVLVCDHASARVPRALGDLGLSRDELAAHIAWDIGAADVARRLAARIDAPLVLSGYSRLVIDCNRPLEAESSIPTASGGVTVPGNADVGPEAAAARAEACFWPYHRAIDETLDARRARGRSTIFFSIHSFTPSPLFGSERPWNVSMLYGRDRRLAALFLEALRRDPSIVVGDNEPYRVTDGGDYSLPRHAEARGLPSVLVELRQDGVDHPDGAAAWAERLAGVYEGLAPRLAAITGGRA